MDRKRQSNDRQARNRIQVLNRIIERPALEQRLVDVREGAAEQNGVTVRTGAGDRGGTQRTAAAADVFDDYRSEQRFDLLHPWPGKEVERATRRKWNHEPDRPRRIGLCACNARDGRQSGNAGGQLQKLSAGKFHGASSKKNGVCRRRVVRRTAVDLIFSIASPPTARAPPLKKGFRHVPLAARHYGTPIMRL